MNTQTLYTFNLPEIEWWQAPKDIPETPSDIEILHLSDWQSLIHISNCKNLKHLNITNNNIPQLPEELLKCDKLETLYLSFNPNLDPKQAFFIISQLPNLKRLKYYNNNPHNQKITIPESFQKLNKLVELHIQGNISNTKHLFSYISQLPNLIKLNIANLNFDFIPEEFSNLTSVKELIIGANFLKLKILFKTAALLPNLEYLEIDQQYIYTPRIYIVPKEIGNLKNIRKMYLFRNTGFKKIPDSIQNCTQLQELDLRFSATDKEKQHLRELLPNCLIS